MAKCWSVTALVALALLSCLGGRNVDAQDSMWQRPATPMSKGAPPPQAPKVPPHPEPPPKAPQYSQVPQVQPPPPQKVPQYPVYRQVPEVQPPPQPKIVPRPQQPQVYPPSPQFSQNPQPPKLPPPPPQKVPQYPVYRQAPEDQPPPLPKIVPRPQQPQVYPPSPQFSQNPQLPKLPPPPPQKVPQYPVYRQAPEVQPPPQPKIVPRPQQPQVYPPSPQFSQNPQPPKLPPPPPQKVPQYPVYRQAPEVQPPPQPKIVPRPQQPQVPQNPQPPKLPPPPPPKYTPYPYAPPAPHLPQNRQPPKLPPPPSQKVSPYRQPQLYPRAFSNFNPPQEPEAPHPQQPHQPTSPQAPSSYQPSVPKQPDFQSCEVAGSQRVPCGGPDISAAACEAISCCFDGRQCYFGKAVTVQCTKDAQFIVVVAKDATLPHIDLESISLLGQGQGCTHVDSNSEFAIYQFPVTACGSFVMEEPGVIIYENMMSSSYEVGVGHLGAITRDSYYELRFQCRYTGTSVETVVVEVLPLQDPPLPVAALGPIRVHLRLANGQCHTKGCNELDVAYSSFYTEADYPVTKVLRDPVYVEVQLIEKTDPNLVLTLGHCWTTTSPNPHSLPQWDILIDGCPYRDDRYLSSLVPVGPSSGVDFPSHYRRFIFKMFTFVDPNSVMPLKEQVYIHCSTAVCTAAPGRSCEPSCFRRKRDVEAVDQRKAEPKVVVSVGPVIMGAPEQEPAQSVDVKNLAKSI